MRTVSPYIYKDRIENSSCSFSHAVFCLYVRTVIMVEPVFGIKQGDINGGFMTRLGFKMSLTSYGGRHRTVRRKTSGIDLINELRCTATSSFFVSPCTCPVCQTGFVLLLSCIILATQKLDTLFKLKSFSLTFSYLHNLLIVTYRLHLILSLNSDTRKKYNDGDINNNL